MSPVLVSAALLLLASSLSSGVLGATGWSYEDRDWGGVCKTGKAQSPIDIQSVSEPDDHVEPLLFLQYDKKVAATLANNGHTVVMKLRQPCNMAVAAGGLRSYYILDHLHFHWTSEHTIDGKSLPVEVHFVHYDNSYANISEAMNKTKGLAVIGVLFHEDEVDNDLWTPLLDKMEEVNPKSGEKSMQFYPGDLLPKDKTEFYRYQGSLTTPPCSESVIWTVMKDTEPISKRQVALLRGIKLSHGAHKSNNRPTLPLNDRVVHLLSTKIVSSAASFSASIYLSLAIPLYKIIIS